MPLLVSDVEWNGDWENMDIQELLENIKIMVVRRGRGEGEKK